MSRALQQQQQQQQQSAQQGIDFIWKEKKGCDILLSFLISNVDKENDVVYINVREWGLFLYY